MCASANLAATMEIAVVGLTKRRKKKLEENSKEIGPEANIYNSQVFDV